MNKLKLVLILLILIASIENVNASTTEIVKTQYKPFFAYFGFGEVLYKITNDVGEVSYLLSRNGLRPIATFTNKVYYQVNSGSLVTIPIAVSGCCLTMDGQYIHEHAMYVFNDVTGKLEFQSSPVIVGSEEKNIQTSISITPPNAVGLYKYNIREKIGLNLGSEYILATGNLIVISIQVGTSEESTLITPVYTPVTTGEHPIKIDIGCVFGSFMIDGQCAKVIPQLPGFEIMFGIVGIIGVFLVNKGRKL